jgi:membrane protease YdiL (CAAX protease family)
LAVVALVVLLPVVKWAQFELDIWDGWRQLFLVVLAGVAVAISLGRSKLWWSALARWQLAMPAPARSQLFADGRGLRLMLGITTVFLAALAVPAAVRMSPKPVPYVFVLSSLVPLVCLIVAEVRRARLRRRSNDESPLPDRAVLWVVTPAVIWWAVLLLQAGVRGKALDGTLGGEGCVLWADGGAGRALCIALVIALGEEYLYRGLLLVLAVRAHLDQYGFVLLSLSFAAWHLPDAAGKGGAVAVMTFLATFAFSHLIFFPLRLRSRSLAGPVLLHAANNVGWRLV